MNQVKQNTAMVGKQIVYLDLLACSQGPWPAAWSPILQVRTSLAFRLDWNLEPWLRLEPWPTAGNLDLQPGTLACNLDPVLQPRTCL